MSASDPAQFVRVGRLATRLSDTRGRAMAAVYVRPEHGVLVVAIPVELRGWHERIAVGVAQERASAGATHGLIYVDEIPARPRVLGVSDIGGAAGPV